MDAVIMPQLAWKDSVRREPALARMARPEQITVAQRDRRCLISPASDLSMAELDNALEAMERDGSLPAMRVRLGLPPAAANAGAIVNHVPRR